MYSLAIPGGFGAVKLNAQLYLFVFIKINIKYLYLDLFDLNITNIHTCQLNIHEEFTLKNPEH